MHSASPFIAPFISVSTNIFFGSPFTLQLQQPIFKPFQNHSTCAMAATCIHSSRTENSPQTHRNTGDDLYKYLEYCRRTCFPDLACCVPISDKKSTTPEEEVDDLWMRMRDETRSDVEQEPILASYYFSSILSHDSMESALSNYISIKLGNSILPSGTLHDLFFGVLKENQQIVKAVKDDLRAAKERDPACVSYVHCFLNFKGFLACQAHRIAHYLWSGGRKTLALLIQNRVSEVFGVDIHPGAKIGKGILLDHATGVVIGETAVIGDNVSILHNVTLGGTGKVSGDRHPKIGNGVLIGAGTCVLGNVRIGDGAKIGAGSVVLKPVPARTTAVGNPAKLIAGKIDKMPSLTMDHTSHISGWSDYVI